MDNMFCLFSHGKFGAPKVKIGQKWVDDDERGNPFLDENNYRIVVEIKKGWVKYSWGLGITMHSSVNHFRWLNTLVEDVVPLRAE